MAALFKTIPTLLTPKHIDYYLKKYQTTIKAVGEKLYFDKMNTNIPAINRGRLEKKK